MLRASFLGYRSYPIGKRYPKNAVPFTWTIALPQYLTGNSDTTIKMFIHTSGSDLRTKSVTCCKNCQPMVPVSKDQQLGHALNLCELNVALISNIKKSRLKELKIIGILGVIGDDSRDVLRALAGLQTGFENHA